MKTLITKLQKEVGLTEKQACKAVEIFRKYILDNKKDPDLVEAVKIKTVRAANKAKAEYNKVEGKIEDWVEDKTEEVVVIAKKKAKKVVDKLSNYLDD